MKTSVTPQKSDHTTPETKPSECSVTPLQQLQRTVGNFGLQRFVQMKLQVGAADDPLEHEADRVAQQVAGMGSSRRVIGPAAVPHAQAVSSVAPSVLASLGGGSPLDAGTRANMQHHFGIDFGGVRVHTGDGAAQVAKGLGARAFTVGQDIYFGAGQHAPASRSGQRLLAHEVAHVVQQSGGASAHAPVQVRGSAPKGQQIHANGDTAAAAQPGPITLPTAESINIPIERLRPISNRDVLVGVFGTNLVALPVQGQAWTIAPPVASGTVEGPSPLMTIPTVGKEGLVAVNVGGRAAFLIDAGGSPLVVSTSALAAINSALNVNTIRGVVITHIHSDHIQSFVEIVVAGRIRPENIHYAAAFETVLRPYLNAVRSDASLAPLGYSATTTFSTIATPSAGAFFRETRVEGDVTLDYYGLVAAMNALPTNTASLAGMGRGADTGSLLTRVTHRPTGTGILYVGDLRGGDLTQFRLAMGEPAYNEMVTGVRVIQGLQHHLGALGSPTTAAGRADREGLVDLLTRTYLRSGSLTVMGQSSPTYGGRQFLNRGLIAGLNALGIDVEVALKPSATGAVGTITINTEGGVTHAGGGAMESHPGSAVARAEVVRLTKLREAEEVLTRYGHHVANWQSLPNLSPAAVRAARELLEAELTRYVASTIGNVGSDAAARSTPAVTSPAAQATALQRVQASGTSISDRLMPSYMQALRDLNRLGPSLDTYMREMKAARSTGRLSDAGIEALWEIDPEMAQRLVRTSPLPRAEQRRVGQQLPGAPPSGGTRAVGGLLLAVEIVNLAAPIIQQAKASNFNNNVVPSMNDILWWQEKGVFPRLQAVNNDWFRGDADMSTDVPTINSWIRANNVAYLAMTWIDEAFWDHFMIWASANIRNFADWGHYVLESDTVKGEGQYVNDKIWKYRKGWITSSWSGYSLDTSYQGHPRLTRILNGVAGAMVDTTEAQLARRANEAGAGTRPSVSAPGYRSTSVLNNLQRASGRRQFAPGATPTLYTLAGERERTGFSRECIFYTYPNSASRDPVPSEYVVVSGANYRAYVEIYATVNQATTWAQDGNGNDYSYVRRFDPNTLEILLAKSSDLVAAK
jgi:hypothetical protein